MIGLKTKVAFLTGGSLFAAGFIVWPGCATPPLPDTRTPLSTHKRAEFSFKNNAHPSKDELVAKLGQPDEYYEDLRVSCYKLNRLKRRTLYLFLGILPMAWSRDGDGLEVAMIQYDDHERAQRIGIKKFDSRVWSEGGDQSVVIKEDKRGMREAAQEWVAKPTSISHEHSKADQPK
jgi:hypothetical protein